MYLVYLLDNMTYEMTVRLYLFNSRLRTKLGLLVKCFFGWRIGARSLKKFSALEFPKKAF